MWFHTQQTYANTKPKNVIYWINATCKEALRERNQEGSRPKMPKNTICNQVAKRTIHRQKNRIFFLMLRNVTEILKQWLEKEMKREVFEGKLKRIEKQIKTSYGRGTLPKPLIQMLGYGASLVSEAEAEAEAA